MRGSRDFQPPALLPPGITSQDLTTWSDRGVWSLESPPALGVSACRAHRGADATVWLAIHLCEKRGP